MFMVPAARTGGGGPTAAGTPPPACPPSAWQRSPREAPRLTLRTARAAPWPGLPTARRGPGHGAQAQQTRLQERLGRPKFLPSFGPPEMAVGVRHFRPRARGRRGGAPGWLLAPPSTLCGAGLRGDADGDPGDRAAAGSSFPSLDELRQSSGSALPLLDDPVSPKCEPRRPRSRRCQAVGSVV